MYVSTGNLRWSDANRPHIRNSAPSEVVEKKIDVMNHLNKVYAQNCLKEQKLGKITSKEYACVALVVGAKNFMQVRVT